MSEVNCAPSGKKGLCRNCNRTKWIAGSGLCGSCHAAVKGLREDSGEYAAALIEVAGRLNATTPKKVSKPKKPSTAKATVIKPKLKAPIIKAPAVNIQGREHYINELIAPLAAKRDFHADIVSKINQAIDFLKS